MRPADDRFWLAGCSAHQLEAFILRSLRPSRLRQILRYCWQNYSNSSNNNVLNVDTIAFTSTLDYLMLRMAVRRAICDFLHRCKQEAKLSIG